MCKFCSEQELGIRIKLLGKALVLCRGSMNRAKCKSPAMWRIGWGKRLANFPSHPCACGPCVMVRCWGSSRLPWQRVCADGSHVFKQAGAWLSLTPEELVPANPSVGLSEDSGGVSALTQSFALNVNSRCESELFCCSWLGSTW